MEVAHFNILDCPLNGIHLIEASAGTGKTWAICGLYLRLIATQALTVQQILVVSFTRAATGELRERIRSRINACIAYLENQETTTDPFIKQFLDHAEENEDTLRARLQHALQNFDEAAIYTIHGFCAHALADSAFSGARATKFNLVENEEDLIISIAQDFWRRRIAGIKDIALIDFLLAQKITPKKLKDILKRHIARPLAKTYWPDLAFPERDFYQEAHTLFTQAMQIWAKEERAIRSLLNEAITTKQLDGRAYKANKLEAAFLAWTNLIDETNPNAQTIESELGLLCANMLSKKTNKNHTTPKHDFFNCLENLFEARAGHNKIQETAYLTLIRDWIDEANSARRNLKMRLRIQSNDDLLKNLFDALQNDSGDTLHVSLRKMHPCALIDEFQDTDPLQYAIFSNLYRNQTGPIFFVGDPKQAIYAFRNADLKTYLRAREDTKDRHTLLDNQRASADLINACNTFFKKNPRVFFQAGLNYIPVTLGSKPRTTFVDTSKTAAFQVWLLPEEKGQYLSQKQAEQRAARATAAEIARLLQGAQDSQIKIGENVLNAGDIAVLVRSHNQARIMRDVLWEFSISSALQSKEGIYKSHEAEDLTLLLAALLKLQDSTLLRAALATPLLGFSASDILALHEDEVAFDSLITRFAHYRNLWQQQGIGTALYSIMRNESFAQRLLPQRGGERTLTNFLHLVELLHQAEDTQMKGESLLRWLQNKINANNSEEAAQLRLESDAARVQIITIHKSKGLEYPIVFCPFLWKGNKSDKQSYLAEEYRNGAQQIIDYRLLSGERIEEIKYEHKHDDSAEFLRMVYVAITRAIYRCYLIAGIFADSDGSNVTRACKSLLNWIAAGENFTPQDWFNNKLGAKEINTAWQSLASPSLSVITLPNGVGSPFKAKPLAAERLQLAPLPKKISPPWRIASFSSLSANTVHEPRTALDEGLTNDPQAALEPVPTCDILAFSRGPEAGVLFHALFEHCDFTQPTTWDKTARNILASYPLRQADQTPEMQNTALISMLNDVLNTNLLPGLALAQIGCNARLDELEFLLPSSCLSADAVNALVRNDARAPLQFSQIKGYLKGFIDLVFYHQGRYYILDWKSNHLGTHPIDYGPSALNAAMEQHDYRLQALIYSLALKRHLARCLRNFDFERDFGGVFYLFVRGVRPHWKNDDGSACGVYFEPPNLERLNTFEAALMGEK